MKRNEILESAKGLFAKLGGVGNPDARIVRGLIEIIKSDDLLMKRIFEDLPSKRDWLDPMIEAQLRDIISK
jgi:hypothetical protein